MVLILLAIILHIYATIITHKRIEKNNYNRNNPLYDIIHDHKNTSIFMKYDKYTNLLLLLFILPFCKRSSYKPLIKLAKIFAVITIMRSFAIISTDMPRCNLKCKQDKMTIYNLIFGHCNDKIFSGHTAFTLLTILVANHYRLISNNTFKVAAFLQLIYAYSLIANKHHYTVDVLLAYYITIPLFVLLKDVKL